MGFNPITKAKNQLQNDFKECKKSVISRSEMVQSMLRNPFIYKGLQGFFPVDEGWISVECFRHAPPLPPLLKIFNAGLRC